MGDDRSNVILTGQAGDLLYLAKFGFEDGALDATFGTNGLFYIGEELNCRRGQAVAFQSNQPAPSRIIVVGESLLADFQTGICVAGVTPSGQLDVSFGAGGILQFEVPVTGINGGHVGLQIDPMDRSIWLAATTFVGAEVEVGIFHALPDGAHDAAFGGGRGQLSFTVDGYRRVYASSLVIQPDGKLVVGASFAVPETLPPYATPLVMRLRRDGSLDPSFGQAGIVTLPDVARTHWSYPVKVSLQRQGGIIVVGTGYGATGLDPDFSYAFISRITSEGEIDAAFGPR